MIVSPVAGARKLIVVAAVLILGACATVEQEAPPPPVEMDEQSFLSRGGELLESSTPQPLLAHISEYGHEFGDASESLLNMYGERELSVVEDLVADGEPFRALARLGSLSAIADLTRTRAPLEQQIIALLRSGGHTAAAETLLSASPSTGSQLAIPEQQAISDYRQLLGKVHVRSYFENPDGLERFNADTFSGSGFLLTGQYLLTAYHVVEEVHWPDTKRSEIEVFVDDTWVEAELLAWDSILDLAILELAETQTPRVNGLDRLSRRSDLELGEPVFTLGHHSGLTETLTRGVVSAPRRRAPELGEWIQIDAAVTSGASGGLLIGSDGLIQGLVVAGLIGEDLNFAVPAASIRTVVDRLLRGESIRKPWLGISLVPEPIGEADESGIEIRDVFPSSPLAQHNIDKGATIMEINHQQVDTVAQAQTILGASYPGNAIHIAVRSGDEHRDYWVMALSRPDYAVYNGHGRFDRIDTLYPFFGFSVDVTGVDSVVTSNEAGNITVLLYPVSEVDQASFVASRGIQKGDRIGIIADEFIGMTRVLRILHIPRGMSLETLHQVSDYIYTIERGRYDQNIL